MVETMLHGNGEQWRRRLGCVRQYVAALAVGLLTLWQVHVAASAAWADAEQSMHRLSEAVTQTPHDGMPPSVLSDSEIAELTALVKTRYKTLVGGELSDAQAAVLVGQLSGIIGRGQSVQTLLKASSQPSLQAVPSDLQAGTYPSGVIFYPGLLLQSEFWNNETATSQSLSGKHVVVGGTVRRSGSEPYASDGDFAKAAERLPSVSIDGFVGYLSDPAFDLGLLTPGKIVHLYCHDIRKGSFAVQGMCRVLYSGTAVGGKLRPDYTNNELRAQLHTPARQLPRGILPGPLFRQTPAPGMPGTPSPRVPQIQAPSAPAMNPSYQAPSGAGTLFKPAPSK